jgi:hypothetical protein
MFDVLAERARSRRRTADHERVFLLLSSFTLRPGFGHSADAERMTQMTLWLLETLAFPKEARNWQQLFIAVRRTSGGFTEESQERLRDRFDPFVAPQEEKRPKGLRPGAEPELREMLSWLERVTPSRRAELGGWLLEATWTDRDPRIWAAIGRVGARQPAYASAHHVVNPALAERWLDQLLREKWADVPTAPRAAWLLARLTGDRTRDLCEGIRLETVRRLQAVGAPDEWWLSVREFIMMKEQERAELFGEDIPVGLKLLRGDLENGTLSAPR